jgi:hypothetical protein
MTEPDPKASWQFRYFLTRQDVQAFECLPHPLVGKEKLMLLLPFVAFGMVYAFFHDSLRAWLPYAESRLAANLTAMAVLMLIAYFAVLLQLSIYTSLRIALAPLAKSETHVEAFFDHVSVTEDGQTRAATWEMVRVTEDPAHVFLLEAPHQAIILPRSAFKDDDEMRSFARWADDLVRDCAKSLAPDHDHSRDFA